MIVELSHSKALQMTVFTFYFFVASNFLFLPRDELFLEISWDLQKSIVDKFYCH